MARRVQNPTPEQVDKFVTLVAQGYKMNEAYCEVFGIGADMAPKTIQNRAGLIATEEVRQRIEDKKKEFADEAAKRPNVADTTELSGVDRQRLIDECEFVMINTKPCIYKKPNGVPIMNKDAAETYLKALTLSAKLLGAFKHEEEIDSQIEVVMTKDVEELSG